MSFDINDLVEPLDFNFRQYGPQGVIPEPSQDAVEHFQEEMASLAGGATSQEQLAEWAAGLTDAQRKEQRPRLVAAIAAVCGGEPSLETIQALPHRVLMHFVGYLTAKLLDPTGAASGQKR